MNTIELVCGHTRTVVPTVAKFAENEGYIWCVMCGGYRNLGGAEE